MKIGMVIDQVPYGLKILSDIAPGMQFSSVHEYPGDEFLSLIHI